VPLVKYTDNYVKVSERKCEGNVKTSRDIELTGLSSTDDIFDFDFTDPCPDLQSIYYCLDYSSSSRFIRSDKARAFLHPNGTLSCLQMSSLPFLMADYEHPIYHPTGWFFFIQGNGS